MTWQSELARMNANDERLAPLLGKALDELGIKHKPTKSRGLHSEYSIIPRPASDYMLYMADNAQIINVSKKCKAHYRLIHVGTLDLTLPVEERKERFAELINTEPSCAGWCDNEDEEDEEDEVTE